MADVSHELRTPLARIRVALELAAEDPVAAKDVLADVGADLDEIDQLIADILTTARLDGRAAHDRRARRPPSASSPTARVAAVRRAPSRPHARARRSTAATARSSAIRCCCAARSTTCSTTPPSTPTRDAGAARGRTRTARRVAFEIVDTRHRHDAPTSSSAPFTPFWRADGSRARKTGGVGLGLALARRIARAHGGDVTLASAPGQRHDRAPRGSATCDHSNRNGAMRRTKYAGYPRASSLTPRIARSAVASRSSWIKKPWASRRDADHVLDGDRSARATIAAQVTANGTLSARSTVQVGAQVSGRVVELHADFNDKVKKGQVIAKLDEQRAEGADRSGAGGVRPRARERRRRRRSR